MGLRLRAGSVASRHTAGRALPADAVASTGALEGAASISKVTACGSMRNSALQLWQRSASLALIASHALHSLRFREDEHDEHHSSPTLLSCPHARHLSVAMVCFSAPKTRAGFGGILDPGLGPGNG